MEFAISQPKKCPIATKEKANISIELNDHRVWPQPWPWKVRYKGIYRIMTMVILNVGAPSTRLVYRDSCFDLWRSIVDLWSSIIYSYELHNWWIDSWSSIIIDIYVMWIGQTQRVRKLTIRHWNVAIWYGSAEGPREVFKNSLRIA